MENRAIKITDIIELTKAKTEIGIAAGVILERASRVANKTAERYLLETHNGLLKREKMIDIQIRHITKQLNECKK